jgi:hypothetical protein
MLTILRLSCLYARRARFPRNQLWTSMILCLYSPYVKQARLPRYELWTRTIFPDTTTKLPFVSSSARPFWINTNAAVRCTPVPASCISGLKTRELSSPATLKSLHALGGCILGGGQPV